MPIRKEKDRRNGQFRLLVEKNWPHGSGRFRRRFQLTDKAIAKDLERKIESACADGSWPALKRQLEEPPPKPLTVAEFVEGVYVPWCREHNRRPEFKTFNLKPIVRFLGAVPVRDLNRTHAVHFKRERKKERVANGTVNRGLAVLSHMAAIAIDEGLITVNPFLRFKKLPEPPQKELFMSIEQERALVKAVMAINIDVGLLSGVVGETGLRVDDALQLRTTQINLDRQVLIRRTSKTGAVVHIPLSPYAIELLAQVPRVVGSPWVFTQVGTREHMTERVARSALNLAREKVKLDWVSFHDFRRFRATQWYIHGVPVRDIQGLLGHKDIQTTMRYIQFAPTHAASAVINAQKQEQEAAVQATANI